MTKLKEAEIPGEARRLIPVTEFNRYYPDPSTAALRWLRFTNKNDFNRCVVRRGRRVLIDEVEYFKWLNQQHSKNENEE